MKVLIKQISAICFCAVLLIGAVNKVKAAAPEITMSLKTSAFIIKDSSTDQLARVQSDENVNIGNMALTDRQDVTARNIATCNGSKSIENKLMEAALTKSQKIGGKIDGNDETGRVGIAKAYGKLPLYFIENRGQLDKEVLFYEKGAGHNTLFTADSIYISLTTRMYNISEENKMYKLSSLNGDNDGKDRKAVTRTIRLVPIGMNNKGVKVIGERLEKHKVNYLIGSDPKAWQIDIPTYSAVLYKDIWDGIDLRFYGKGQTLEYDVIVHKGADLSMVRFTYNGIEALAITDSGDLKIRLGDGYLIQKCPYIYQEINGRRVEVAGRFVLCGQFASQKKCNSPVSVSQPPNVTNSQFAYKFDIKEFDASYPLIIDPALVYSTYLGGSGFDGGLDIAVDSTGNAYITGITDSINFPTVLPLQGFGESPSSLLDGEGGFFAGGDVFVVKMKVNVAGNGLVYSTYLGGGRRDLGRGIAVDSAGLAYVTGVTESIDFPIISSIQPFLGPNDGFVSKLNSTGNALVYSTYLGTDGNGGRDIAVDINGHAYITGSIWAANFNVNHSGGNDVFIAKLSVTANGFDYFHTFGGSGDDGGKGIAVDRAGNAYVTGDTDSVNFPTLSPMQSSLGRLIDAFVIKVDAAGRTQYSTYLGGGSDDIGTGIAVDSTGNMYVTGSTNSTNFPTESPIQLRVSDDDLDTRNDVFVTKINNSGRPLVYSTYLGGSGEDHGNSITVDSAGNAYVTGSTNFFGFPIVEPIQNFGGAIDAFVIRLNATGSAIDFSTYLGGEDSDWGNSIAVDNAGSMYVTGMTTSIDFPTVSPIQNIFAGGERDLFVAKLTALTAKFTASTRSGAPPLIVEFKDESIGDPETWFWNFGDGDTSTEKNPSHLYTEVGKFAVSLTVANKGNVDTVTSTDFIEIIPTLTAKFTASTRSGEIPLFIEFKDESIGNPEIWFWNFGDGDTSTEKNPSHLYTEVGKFTVSLTVTNTGAVNTVSSTDFIEVLPILTAPASTPTPELTLVPTPDATPELTPVPTPDATPELTPVPTPDATPELTPVPTPDDGDETSKSFTFRCRQHSLIAGKKGIFEKMVMELGANEQCTVTLTNLEPGVPVEFNTLIRKGLRSAIRVNPENGVTNSKGELEFTVTAISKGFDWIAWAVKNDKGQFEFSKRAYDNGTAWGMFVEVK